jgi:putative effector of murein hydrolase
MIAFRAAILVAITVGAYALSRAAARWRRSALTTPVFFSTALIILALALTGTSIQDYRAAKDVIVLLLGPATVALAVPLYRTRDTLVRSAMPMVAGLAVGSISTLLAPQLPLALGLGRRAQQRGRAREEDGVPKRRIRRPRRLTGAASNIPPRTPSLALIASGHRHQ